MNFPPLIPASSEEFSKLAFWPPFLPQGLGLLRTGALALTTCCYLGKHIQSYLEEYF